MNVNSIKINNVYHNGEVDLDLLLPETVEGLDVIKGLDENTEILGAKNLLPLSLETMKKVNTIGTWSNNVYTYVGVTFTVNIDDYGNVLSIDIDTTNKAATSYIGFNLFSGAVVTLPENCIYTLSASANNDNFNSSVFSGEDTLGLIAGASATTGSAEISATSFDRANIYMGLGGSDIVTTLYPMIRLASDPNNTYRPYAKGNVELTSDVNMLNNNKEVLGAKNMMPMKSFTATQSGVTIVCNESGATLNGTPTGTYGFIITNDFTLPSGDYILSGCPSSGGYQRYQMEISKKPSGGRFAQLGLDTGSGFSFSALATDTFRVAVYVYSQYGEYSDFKYYPMIRLASDPNNTYRPYAMSNQELTQRLLSLEQRVAALEG